ncbi:MAG: hypothetical protein NC548_57955 [Lachnospiraceae bacterium]|nr:hypothetical protein [Lachnospiraceae bacterium]
MAVTTTKVYNASTFAELVADVQEGWDWKSIDISEDGAQADFYVSDELLLRLSLLNGNNTYIYVINNGNSTTVISSSGGASNIRTKITKTSSVFCISCTSSSARDILKPTDEQRIVAVGTATNQLTGAKETAVVYVLQPANNYVQTMIASSDNSSAVISLIPVVYLIQNVNAKITTMQNLFYKNSECIMDDVYILTSTQTPALAYGDCTFNGKKYYMQGCIMLADD